MFDSKEEVNQKLATCACLFNNLPVLVDEAVGKKSDIIVRYRLLRTGEPRSNPLSEPGWEFRNLGDRVGYMNVDYGKTSYQEAVYMLRKAVRQAHNTQGLSAKNMRLPKLKGSSRLSLMSSAIGWDGIVMKPFFADMLEQKYPSLSEIKTEMGTNSYLTSKAFSRQFAVNRPDVGPFFMEYRGNNIGYSEDLDRWKISDDFLYLRETLEHLNLKVA